MHPRQPRLPFANAWFFPVAALYAAFILPISVFALLGLIPAPPGLSTPSGHAHEMLFGFALAVVAGYLLGPQPLRLILSLLGCWALARLSFVLWPGSWLALASAATFAGAVAWKVLPRFSAPRRNGATRASRHCWPGSPCSAPWPAADWGWPLSGCCWSKPCCCSPR